MTAVAMSARHAGPWHATLDLAFDETALGTRLASRKHSGPLVVQRALYPEGPAVCHAIVVHPPGGMAGGDDLRVGVGASGSAHALLTTPGASKVYKSAGAVASQQVRLSAADDACIEWLPQETIVFDAADASLGLEIQLSDRARAIAWEITTLGRAAMGERFASGRLRTRFVVHHEGATVLHEVGSVCGTSPFLRSPVGWRNARACGTMIVAGPSIDDALLQTCRDALGEGNATAAVSRLTPQLLVVRYLGPSATHARATFVGAWRCLRNAVAGRPAVLPRIWST
jgi:urease accessory protein